MGLRYLPDEAVSLWSLNAVVVPDGLEEGAVRDALLNEHGIEVGGGLGPLKGHLLRVGLMGYGSQQPFVLQLLGALELVLADQGSAVEPGMGVSKAMEVYRSERDTVEES